MNSFILGLTGQTGAGKSTVARFFKENNIPIIDADQIAHSVINDEKQCLADIVLEYGIFVLYANGTLNRKKLAKIVFSDKDKLKRLNQITFPYIIAKIKSTIDQHKKSGESLVVLDAPLMYESGADKLCSTVIAVIADADIRMNRILIRDRLTDDEARNRINSQHQDDFYRSRADHILINDGSIKELAVSLNNLLSSLEME